MKDFISLSTLSYKVYENDLTLKKGSLFNKFPNGGLFAYTTKGDNIIIYCRIVITDFSAEGLIKDIAKIKITNAEKGYCFMFVGDSYDSLEHCECITKVLHEYAPAYTRFDTFRKVLMKETAKELIMFIASSKEDELVIEVDYNVMHIKALRSRRTAPETKSESRDENDIPKPYFSFESLKNLSDSTEDQIKSWLSTTTFAEFKRAISERVIGQKNLRLVLVNVYQYLQNAANGNFTCRNNTILCAPSGCGKTETYRALKAYFKQKIPKLIISIVDTNQITSEGFRGSDTGAIVTDLKKGGSNGIGIVFLDEFDKRLVPEYTSYGDDVDARVQAQILETIEGYTLNGIDTSKTLFIGMGSFNVVRTGRESEKKIGFGVDRKERIEDHYSDISRKEMIEMGASYELIGRFTSIINYYSLSPEAIDQIIDLRLREISSEVGYIVTVSSAMREFLHENANTEFGNRLIYSLIREPVNSALAEIMEFEIEATGIRVESDGEYVIEAPAESA